MQDNSAAFEFVRPKHFVNDIGRIFGAALLQLQLQHAFSFGRLHFEPGANERAALAGSGNVSGKFGGRHRGWRRFLCKNGRSAAGRGNEQRSAREFQG